MSMISEQVKGLREIAKNFSEWEYNRFYDIISQAADTIESLSAKPAAANMEKSDDYYGGGWISCEDRLPDKDDIVLIDTGIGYFEIATYSGDGKTFYTEECGSSCPIAWQPLPEPYHP